MGGMTHLSPPSRLCAVGRKWDRVSAFHLTTPSPAGLAAVVSRICLPLLPTHLSFIKTQPHPELPCTFVTLWFKLWNEPRRVNVVLEAAAILARDLLVLRRCSQRNSGSRSPGSKQATTDNLRTRPLVLRQNARSQEAPSPG